MYSSNDGGGQSKKVDVCEPYIHARKFHSVEETSQSFATGTLPRIIFRGKSVCVKYFRTSLKPHSTAILTLDMSVLNRF